MSSGEQATAAPHEFFFEDKDGRFGPYLFRPASVRQMQVFNRIFEVHSQKYRPLDAVAEILPKLPEPERSRVFAKAESAMGRWRPTTALDPLARVLLNSNLDVQVGFLESALRYAKPDISPEEVERVIQCATPNEVSVVFTMIVGGLLPAEAGDPKADSAELAEETEEEKLRRSELELKKRLLSECWMEMIDRTLSPFSWISTHSSLTSFESLGSSPTNAPK